MTKFSNGIYLVIATIFAILVTYIDVFLNIDFLDIGDRVNYVALAGNVSEYFQQIQNISIFVVLRDEPIFSITLYIFNSIGLTSIQAVRLIIFISSVITFFIMMDKGRIPIYAFLFLFFFDWFIHNYVNSIRMSFATSIFLYAWFYLKGRRQMAFFLITPFIHYTFFIILGLLLLRNFFKRNHIGSDISIIITASIGTIFGIFIFIISSFLGFGELSTRYSNFDSFIGISTGPLFFLCLLVIFMLQNKNFKQENLFSLMILSFYVSCVLFFPPISRVLISTIVLILVSGFSINNYYKYLFVILIFMYTATFAFSGRLTEALFLNW